MRHNPRLFVAFLCIILILPASATRAHTTDPGLLPINRESAAEGLITVYAIDPEQIRREFRETGEVVLSLPTGEEVTVQAQETRIFAEDFYYVAGKNRDDIIEKHPIRSVAVEGKVSDEPSSAARLLLGDWGIYGRLYFNGTAYDFDPQEVEGINLQFVTDRQIPMVDDERFLSRSYQSDSLTLTSSVNSYVIYDVEQSYMNNHPDWYDRISGSFLNIPPLFEDADITLLLSGPWGWQENMVTANDCTTALNQYVNWLDTHLSSLANAYQLWTKRDLTKDGWGYKSYGCGWSDRATIGYHGKWASSIAEGTNYFGDAYDANSAFERGIVSGHELTHIYGEQYHRGHCFSYNNCNIMADGVDNSYRKFYWDLWNWPTTDCQVHLRFHWNGDCT